MLYLLILLQPLTGWIMVSAADYPISLFGWLTFPAIVGPTMTSTKPWKRCTKSCSG